MKLFLLRLLEFQQKLSVTPSVKHSKNNNVHMMYLMLTIS